MREAHGDCPAPRCIAQVLSWTTRMSAGVRQSCPGALQWGRCPASVAAPPVPAHSNQTAHLVEAESEGCKLRLDGRLQQVPHIQLDEAAAAGGRDRQLAAAGRQVLRDHALAEWALALHLRGRAALLV